MAGKARQKPGWVRAIARKRAGKLLDMAEEERNDHPKRSKRYAELAKKTSEKYNVNLPPDKKKRICPHCGAFLVPGKNLKVRNTKNHETVYACQECGHTQKMGYSRERLKKDKKD